MERRANASGKPKKLTPEVVAIIKDRLLEDWSPEAEGSLHFLAQCTPS